MQKSKWSEVEWSAGAGSGEGLGWAEEALEFLAGVDVVALVDGVDLVADGVDGEAGCCGDLEVGEAGFGQEALGAVAAGGGAGGSGAVGTGALFLE